MLIIYRFILYARFLYSLILMTYYNSIPQDILKNTSNLDPVSEVLEELVDSMSAIHSICEAANDVFPYWAQ